MIKKKIFAVTSVFVLLLVCMCITTTISVKAEQVVQPRMYCVECSTTIGMDRICIPDTRTYSGTREHKCGFLWSKTCTVTSYEAMGAYYCYGCGNAIFFEDDEQEDGYARHHCLEIHSECGAGDNGYYLVCPFS